MHSPKYMRPDADLATRAAKLWPHREHESNCLLGLLCRVGLHRWRRLRLATLIPDTEIYHCFGCAKVKIDGIVYDP